MCKRQAFTKKFGKRYIGKPHCYLVVNGKVYSWHTKGEGITSDEIPGNNACSPVKCCKDDQCCRDKQEKFEKCIEQRIKMDVGDEGDYWWPTSGPLPNNDCCSWANSIVSLCSRIAGCGN